VIFSSRVLAKMSKRDFQIQIKNMASVVASIDLGSNSFYLAYAKVENNTLSPTCRVRKRVRLGQNVPINGFIGEETQAKAFRALEEFRSELDEIGAISVVVAGTAALRKARDSAEFLSRASQILGYPVDVLTGKREAEFVFEGVRLRHPNLFAKRKNIIIDIGGGSTELALGNRHKSTLLSSIHIGCLTWHQFLREKGLSLATYDSILTRSRKFIEADCSRYRKHEISSAFGTSGCWRVLEDVRKLLKIPALDRHGIQQILDWMLYHNSLDDLNLYDASIERLEILPLALALASAFMSALQVSEVTYCDANLQDGLLSIAWRALDDKIA
jgi:exopolyphosphatase / guanosine-5'-triphosphate,3'-diphosphate pyrophosphatase